MGSYVPPPMTFQAGWAGTVWPASEEARHDPETGVDITVLERVGRAVSEGFVSFISWTMISKNSVGLYLKLLSLGGRCLRESLFSVRRILQRCSCMFSVVFSYVSVSHKLFLDRLSLTNSYHLRKVCYHFYSFSFYSNQCCALQVEL